MFVFCCFLCKTFRNLNPHLIAKATGVVFSGGVVALKCGVRRPYLYVPSVGVGASSVLFNRRLLCQLMFHRFKIISTLRSLWSEMRLFRPGIKPILCLSNSQQKHRDVMVFVVLTRSTI